MIGKDVEKDNLDTGDSYMALKLYMGMSRVKTAHDMLLTNMISNDPFP